MRIISLTMNAFMTYKSQTTIDFEDMIENGLYLISGPTGAGKTTIFDAMTFALYGVASGSHRNQSYFRSDFADAKDETYVEMVFELHGKIYKVKRSPTYTRPGYKSAKMANAYLSYNNEMIEGVKEVNQKINQLLGVDVHQFKQIVMIAQGEFTKLIYASSEEREKVLRHIFHSESLVVFENLLKEETRIYKEKYLLSSQQLLSRFQLLNFSKEFMENHTAGFHPSYIEHAIEQNKLLHNQLQIAKSQYEALQNQYDQLSQTYYRKEKQNQDIQEYHMIKEQYQTLMTRQEDMNIYQKDIEKIFAAISEIKRKRGREAESLLQYFDGTFCYFDGNVSDYEDVIRRLCDTHKDLDDDFVKRVMIREEMSPSEYMNIAAVHPIQCDEKSTFITIGIFKKPFRWRKNDINIVFLISVSQKDKTDFLKILRQLIEIFSSSRWMERHSSIDSYEKLIAFIKEYAVYR